MRASVSRAQSILSRIRRAPRQRRDNQFGCAQMMEWIAWCDRFATITEVESGKRNDRPELEKALAACKKQKAKLGPSYADWLI
jgi:DNA invertase Pin-like site-specific DNA recombinase